MCKLVVDSEEYFCNRETLGYLLNVVNCLLRGLDLMSSLKQELKTVIQTFLFFSSSTVGLKLSFRSRYIFFSSRSCRMESLSSSTIKIFHELKKNSSLSHTFQDVSLLQLLLSWSQRESPDQLGTDDVPLQLPLLLRHLKQNVPINQLLLARPLLQLHG